MADFTPLLRRAIAALPANTVEARQRTYNRARMALDALAQLCETAEKESFERQRLALETAIRHVEAKFTQRNWRLLTLLASPLKQIRNRAEVDVARDFEEEVRRRAAVEEAVRSYTAEIQKQLSAEAASSHVDLAAHPEAG